MPYDFPSGYRIDQLSFRAGPPFQPGSGSIVIEAFTFRTQTDVDKVGLSEKHHFFSSVRLPFPYLGLCEGAERHQYGNNGGYDDLLYHGALTKTHEVSKKITSIATYCLNV
mgnify:CR=1 FL=1